MFYRVGFETRKQGAIGVFEIRYTTVDVPDSIPDQVNEAVKMAGEVFRSAGFETSFPSTVTRMLH
jgi:hypothetical protein